MGGAARVPSQTAPRGWPLAYFRGLNRKQADSLVDRRLAAVKEFWSRLTVRNRACLSDPFEEYRDSSTHGAFAGTVLAANTIAKRLQKMAVFVATEESREIVGTIACGAVKAAVSHTPGMPVVPLRKAEALRHSD